MQHGRPEPLVCLGGDRGDLRFREGRVGRVLDRANLANAGLAPGRAEKGRDPTVLGIGDDGDQRPRAGPAHR